MDKTEALKVLRDSERVFSALVGMREAVTLGIGLESAEKTMRASNDVILKELNSGKEKVKKVKADIIKVEGSLQGKLDETNKIHKALKVKLSTERDVIIKDNKDQKNALQAEVSEDRRKHAALKVKHTAEVKIWEKKITEMNQVYEDTKALTLAEVRKR